MSDEKDLRALKSNPKVLELYAKHVQLHREGKGYRGRCPFGSRHARGEDRTPSMDIWAAEDGSFIFKCLGCGSSGNIMQFVMDTEKVKFDEAVSRIRTFLKDTWFEGRDTVDEVFRSPVLEEPKEFITFPISNCEKFTQALRESKDARAFLNSRKIDLDTACRLHVGFRQAMPSEVNVPNDVRDKGWLVFPYIEKDRVVRVKFRSIVSKVFTQQRAMKQQGFFNSNAADPLKPLFLVEGELDCCALESAGFNAVAIPNASYKVTPADKDVLMSSSELFLSGDNDQAAGTEAMKKLWSELQDNVYLLQWPSDIKDANELLMKCEDLGEFKAKVLDLAKNAKAQPMPGVFSLQEAMLNSTNTDMANHPNRLHFPWPSVDSMAICLPGSVVAFTASSSGMGKSQMLMQATLDSAVRHGEVVLNYQAEMSPDEIANIVTAHVLAKDRNELSSNDYQEAARRIRCAKYYIGCSPDAQNSTQVLDLIEHAIRRLSPTIVVLDHLHHICANVSNEIQDQSNAMKRIKGMAQKYGLKFIVVGQPRKSNQQNRGKDIYASDIKGSESIVSASDAVFIIHREIMKDFDPAHPPLDIFSPEIKITLHKGRTKGKGAAACSLIFRGKIATFVDALELEAGVNLPSNEESFFS